MRHFSPVADGRDNRGQTIRRGDRVYLYMRLRYCGSQRLGGGLARRIVSQPLGPFWASRGSVSFPPKMGGLGGGARIGNPPDLRA